MKNICEIMNDFNDGSIEEQINQYSYLINDEQDLINQSYNKINKQMIKINKSNKLISKYKKKIDKLNKEEKKRLLKIENDKRIVNEYKTITDITNEDKISLYNKILVMNSIDNNSTRTDEEIVLLIDNLLYTNFCKKEQQKNMIIYIHRLNMIEYRSIINKYNAETIISDIVRDINYNYLINKEIKEISDILNIK